MFSLLDCYGKLAHGRRRQTSPLRTTDGNSAQPGRTRLETLQSFVAEQVGFHRLLRAWIEEGGDRCRARAP